VLLLGKPGTQGQFGARHKPSVETVLNLALWCQTIRRLQEFRCKVLILPMDAHPNLRRTLGEAIKDTLKELLSEKHLYQSTVVPKDSLEEAAKLCREEEDFHQASPINTRSGRSPRSDFSGQCEDLISGYWQPTNASTVSGSAKQSGLENTMFEAPTVRTYCPRCESNEPFNPLKTSCFFTLKTDDPTVQKYFLSFECQGCKSESVSYLIHRQAMKLTLCGRDPMQVVEVPREIPKPFRERYSAAEIAFNAGQVLAALFLLRVLIEEFWRSQDEVKKLLGSNPRPTGDEMGKAYKETLPQAMRDSFPTLHSEYNELSASIHQASDDSKVYLSARGKVLKHFEARRLFELK